MRIKQLISEIENVEKIAGHRAALQLHRMLDSNRKIFSQHIEPHDLQALITRFESLSEAKTGYYASEWFAREFESAYSLLMFYLRKVV